MLFKAQHLHGIKSGSISLAFRRWEKVAAKKGGLHKTFIGLVEITDVVAIEEKKITEKDARDAGFENRDRLLASLNRNGTIYKIGVRFYSDDPRIQLRESALTDDHFETLKAKLKKMDTANREGPWTMKVLSGIKNNPKLRAIDLGSKLGFEKEWLKPNIRKLKNLGLTISHEVGYELSPLGSAFLKKQAKK